MMNFVLLFGVFWVVIFIHELGHALAYRRMGVPIKMLAVGWPPKTRFACLEIRSAMLRRFFGPEFVFVLSPLIFIGTVDIDATKEEVLSDDKRALIYGAGVIANILLWMLLMSCVAIAAITSGNAEGVRVHLILIDLEKCDPWFMLVALSVVAALLLYYARFICQWIFPIIGIMMFAFVCQRLTVVLGDIPLFLSGGFTVMATDIGRAAETGRFFFLMATWSLAIGLINLLPLFLLDGGHIGLLHLRRWTSGRVLSKIEGFYRRLGTRLVYLLLLLSIAPDVYRVYHIFT